MRSDAPQPDLSLRILPDFGGKVVVKRGLLAGAPELVLEIASSSVSLDLGEKMRLYEQAGVAEYVVVAVGRRRLIGKHLVHGAYADVRPGEDGVYRSVAFPGLWIHMAALWTYDDAALRATLDLGLATPEQAAFAARLTAARKK